MTLSARQPRLLLGRLLIVVSVVLLALWVCYVVLLGLADVWDFCPLAVALAVLVIGVRLARLGKPIPCLFGVSWKRDLVLGLAIGALAELVLWFLINFGHMQLERLQEPGFKTAMAIYRRLRLHHEHTLTVYFASACAFAVLIAMWTMGAFALLSIIRSFRRAKSMQRTS
jgi:hypothetical protein